LVLDLRIEAHLKIDKTPQESGYSIREKLFILLTLTNGQINVMFEMIDRCLEARLAL